MRTSKLARKREKAAETLLAHVARTTSRDPSKLLSRGAPTCALAVLNAGPCGEPGGVSGDQLQAAFAGCAGVKQIAMLFGRPFSFVVFNTADDAKSSFDALNNQFSAALDRHLLLEYATYTLTPDDALGKETVLADPSALSARIPGLQLMPDFLSDEQEAALLHEVYDDGHSWFDLRDRRVKHYGYAFNYGALKLDKESPAITAAMIDIVIRKYNALSQLEWVPEQLTVNEYPPGSGIAPHIDETTEFGDKVLIVSTRSDTVMEFHEVATDTTIHVLLPQRSLAVLESDARYKWEHSIRPRKCDVIDGLACYRKERVSFTFRQRGAQQALRAKEG